MKANKNLVLAVLGLAVLPSLAGCTNDSASYMVGADRTHAITVVRAQPWFWRDTLRLSIIVTRQRDCLGRLDVPNVPKGREISLHRAPDVYPEPIFILVADSRHYAVSTLSCQVQEFKTPPAEPGPRIGRFTEAADGFAFKASEG